MVLCARRKKKPSVVCKKKKTCLLVYHRVHVPFFWYIAIHTVEFRNVYLCIEHWVDRTLNENICSAKLSREIFFYYSDSWISYCNQTTYLMLLITMVPTRLQSFETYFHYQVLFIVGYAALFVVGYAAFDDWKHSLIGPLNAKDECDHDFFALG